MSKDIRSFFTVKTSSSQKKTLNSPESIKKTSNRKRSAAIIIDSDSDEEPREAVVKRSKSSKEEEKRSRNKTNEVEEKRSKYFKTTPVKVKDMFGSGPIKRDYSRKIIKKEISKLEKEMHIDKDLESELLLLDSLDPDLLSLNVLESKSSVNNDSKNTKQVDNNNTESLKTKLSDSQESAEEPHCDESPSKRIKLENKTDGKFISPPKTSLSKRFSQRTQTLASPTKLSSFDSSSMKSLLNVFIKTESQHHKKVNVNKTESLVLNGAKLNKFERKNEQSPAKLNDAKHLAIDLLSSSKEALGNDTCVENTNTSPCKLWVERYKPTATKQIIGQQGDKSCVNKLIVWLKNWMKNQSSNKKLVKPSPWAKNDDGGYFKAALLSGPPGVGKTTTAHLVCKELGFDVVEFNASDTRSKKLLHQEVSELLSSNSLSPFFTGKGEQVTKQHVLLMDEVDGMAGNEDRGGVQELIQLIKQSRVPIICMCNDRNHPKIRSLANYCFDLRFSKPRVEQIRGAMMSVCFKEKMKLTPDVLTEIITSANQDIRLIMNHLSMLSIEKSNLGNSTKFIKMGPWDVVRKVFSEDDHKSMSINDKCDLFFHDYSVAPLFVQENYLNAVVHKPEMKNKIKKMELFAKAAKSLSMGDLTEKSIRSHNAWSLLPVQAVFSCLVPGEVLEGHLGAQINFPAWFGKNSRQTKMQRLLQELTMHSRLKISGNKEAMNLDYLMPLEKSILLPLVRDGLDGVSQALVVLNEYCLIREDLENLSELSSWPNTKNLFSEVESKVKAAFTRAYNKISTPTPYAAVPIKKGSRSEVDNTDDLMGEVEEDIQDQGDEDEDGLETDAMIVKKKPTNKKIEKAAKPSTSNTSKSSKKGRTK